MDISLTPEHEAFVQERARSGLYHSTSEVIIEALYVLQEQEDLRRVRLETLRKEIAIWLAEVERGEAAPLDIEATLAKGRARLKRGH